MGLVLQDVITHRGLSLTKEELQAIVDRQFSVRLSSSMHPLWSCPHMLVHAQATDKDKSGGIDEVEFLVLYSNFVLEKGQ